MINNDSKHNNISFIRKNHGLKSAVLSIVIGAVLCVVLTGCGKGTQELDKYYDNMNNFTNNITIIKDSMESIDTSSENAPADVLACLDSMEEQFRLLSEIEVPKQFAGNEQLADDAYSYMQQAVSMYHEFYDDPECDYSVFEAASENYSRAMKRVGYISSILKGEVPEGEGVDVTEEEATDFDPVTDDSVDEEQ